MKKTKRMFALQSQTYSKLLLHMKLTIVFLLIASLQLSAKTYSQDRITLKLPPTELKSALKQIEKMSALRFLYNTEALKTNMKVTVSADNSLVTDVLTNVLNNTGLSFRILENNLVVITKNELVEDNKDIHVSGKVTNANGEGIAGVTVKIKGSQVGTSTDAKGNYSITAPVGSKLIFSSVSYTTQEVSVASKTEINLVLQPAVKDIGEVVVIGYGTASRRDLTGSIVKVSGKDIADKPNTNPMASLQGKVAGLSIVNNATPGSTPDVRIRGTISIGSVNPVYIVDGNFSDNLDYLNPSEIESIEVLKDPSSLAVFGIKGAAGAILVTTKKAKAGQLNVNFNTSFGSKKLVDKIKLANGSEFRSLMNADANNRIADDPTANSLYNFVNNVGGAGLSAYTGNTDWIDAVTRKAMYNTNNLSVEGSSEKNRFHMGLGYTIDEGLVKHVKYERISANVSDEYKINKIFKVGFNFIASRENLPYNSGALEDAKRALPIMSAATTSFNTKNPYGIDSSNYNLYSTTPIIQNSETNPLATLENNWNKKIDIRYSYIGSAFIDINLMKNLSFKSTWYGNMNYEDNRVYTPLYNLYDPIQAVGSQVFAKNSLTAVNQDLTRNKSFQQDYILTYKKSFNNHSFTAMGGVTTFYKKSEGNSETVSQKNVGVNIIPDEKRLWYITTGFGDVKSVIANGQSEYATVSALARVLYNYKSKYFFNASLRRDGASQINQDYNKKFQNFWAVGGAWEITKEDFMSNQHIFDFLKLKASYGLLGNFNPLGKAYPAYPTISTTASAVFGANLVPVYTPDYEFDPNMKWETVKSSEVGVEANFLHNALHFEADYYSKRTDNLLVLLQRSGRLPMLTNFGSIRNNGFEFSAEYKHALTKDLSFTVGGNLTTFKNKVISLVQPTNMTISTSEQTCSQAQTGFPIGYFYGLVVEGVYQSYADIIASPVSTINGGGALPGDLKYKDLNGDGKIDGNDRKMIGNPTPDFTYAISTNFKYKNFDLGIDFAGSYGGEIYKVWGTSEQKNSLYNYPASYTKGWTGAGTSNWVPIVNQLHLINRAPSTYGIEDGSYIRIRNLSLGYTFNQIPKFKYIKNMRFAVGVQNLKTWKHNDGYSPEFAGSATQFGVDYGNAASALPRVTSVSLNVNF